MSEEIEPIIVRSATKVTVFRDTAYEWRWNLKANNGQIIATSGEGYKNKSHAIYMAEQINPEAELLVLPAAGKEPE